MKSVPQEYQALKEAFPDRFVFFVNNKGGLTNQGKMAMEYLAMKKILQCVEFNFHPKEEVLRVSLGDISVLASTEENELKEIANEFLNGCGFSPKNVYVVK